MSARQNGASQALSAARAGISERSGRTIEHGSGWLPAGQRGRRAHRTRCDPLEGVWESEIVPLLAESPDLQATTILGDLQVRHPGCFPDTVLRTLQRRIRDWRSLSGPEQAVIFPQTVEPGYQALVDFTVADALGVTLGGEAFRHRLVHVRLRYSGAAYVEVVRGGESYAALASGVVHALEYFGGCPQTLRTDSLAAAYRNLSRDGQADLTASFAALCAQYGMQATRNNLGVSHENGGIESPNGHLKRQLDQALLLRGSRDFVDQAAYATFVADVVASGNGRRSEAIARERRSLRPLPAHAAPTYSVLSARVKSSSTIQVARCTYSVPSRLIGRQLTIHLYDDCLQAYLGREPVFSARRHHPGPGNHRCCCIDFRHVITALVRKPGAFRALSYRDALHPTATFRAAWDHCNATLPDREAVRTYLRFLHLAALSDVRSVETWLQEALAARKPLHPDCCETTLRQSDVQPLIQSAPPAIVVTHAAAASYDILLTSCGEASP